MFKFIMYWKALADLHQASLIPKKIVAEVWTGGRMLRMSSDVRQKSDNVNLQHLWSETGTYCRWFTIPRDSLYQKKTSGRDAPPRSGLVIMTFKHHEGGRNRNFW